MSSLVTLTALNRTAGLRECNDLLHIGHVAGAYQDCQVLTYGMASIRARIERRTSLVCLSFLFGSVGVKGKTQIPIKKWVVRQGYWTALCQTLEPNCSYLASNVS